jgi:hypothetical protein
MIVSTPVTYRHDDRLTIDKHSLLLDSAISTYPVVDLSKIKVILQSQEVSAFNIHSTASGSG